MGSGRYSQLLPYSSWLKFNSAQRVHANYVEGIASSLLALLGAGVFYPRAAVVAGFVFMLGREVYGIGYMSGPSGRTAGAILLDVALVAMLGACGVGGWVLEPAWRRSKVRTRAPCGGDHACCAVLQAYTITRPCPCRNDDVGLP